MGTGYWEVKITRENGKIEFYECSFLKKCKKIIRVCKVYARRKQFDAFGR